MGLTAVSLFAGAGGFCLGMGQAGFDVRVAVEIDRYACQTYRANFPDTRLYEGDICGFLAGSQTSHRAEYKLDTVDLVFGGAPCQGFSQFGLRDPNDPRNQLLLEWLRVVRQLRPRMVILENVPGLLAARNDTLRKDLLSGLATLGYGNAETLRLNAVAYGTPQNRKRVVIAATRDDVKLPGVFAQLMTAAFKAVATTERLTVDDAIGDLPDEVAVGMVALPHPAGELTAYQASMRGACQELTSHQTKTIGERRALLLPLLPMGRRADQLPAGVWTGTRPQHWRRLDVNLPSTTILASCSKDMTEYIHPVLNRFLTLRKVARLQGFPDWFVFPVSLTQALKQVGNAVPVPLAQAIGTVAAAILASAGSSGAVRRRGRPSSGDIAMSQSERNAKYARAKRERLGACP